MTPTSPIACTLTATESRDRAGEVGRLARTALLARHRIDGGVRMIFDKAARERLEVLVAAEAECCPFLAMDLRAGEGGLVLEVTGPEAAAPIIAELFREAGQGSATG